MPFDVLGAREEGYTDSEIADYLAQKNKFNVTGARNEGYTDDDIINHLTSVVETTDDQGFLDRTGEMLRGGAQKFAGSSAYGLASGLKYFGALPDVEKELRSYSSEQEDATKDLDPIKPLLEAESVGDVVSSGYDYLVQSSPYMGAMLTGAYGGGKTAAALPIYHPVAKGITIFAGGLLGGAVATYNAFFGDNIKEAEQVKGRDLTEEETEGAALAAVGQSLADAVISKILPGKGSPKLITNTLKKLMQAGGVEGTTEVFQESLSILQANDFNFDSLKTPEAIYRLKEAGLAGAVIGAPIGAATGPFTREPPPATDVTPPELPDVTEGLEETIPVEEGMAEEDASSLETIDVTKQLPSGVVEGVSETLYVDEQGEVGDLNLEDSSSTLRAIRVATPNVAPKQTYPPEVINKIRENLVRRLKARGISEDVALIIVDSLNRSEIATDPESSPSEALFTPQTESAKGAIMLSLDAIPESALKNPKEMALYLAGLTDHETVHSWVDLGVLNDKDMNFLAKAASTAKHWSDPNKTVMEVIRETYSNLDETAQIEEAAAEMFRGHASGQSVLKGRPLSIWQRILNFFRSVKGGLAEADIYNASQVFERIQLSPDSDVSVRPRGDMMEDFDPSLLEEDVEVEAPADKQARTFEEAGSVALTKKEIEFFDSFMGNTANREELLEQVPSLKIANDRLSIDSTDIDNLNNFVDSVGRSDGLSAVPPRLRGGESSVKFYRPFFQSSEGDKQARRIGTTGQYVGAPKGIDSPQKLRTLRKNMLKIAEEGEPGRFWYERSGNSILDLVDGNKEEADKIAQAIAITSAGSTPVLQNFQFAIQAYNQWKAGKPILTGKFPSAMVPRLEKLFDGIDWPGRKTNTFYNNIMASIDPSRSQGVTVDMHMMRVFGFPSEGGTPTPAQYDFVENEVTRIADQLGWTPYQVQAAMWVVQKASRDGKPVSEMTFDYQDALEKNLGQISWETKPSQESGHFPEIFNAPMNEQADYHFTMSKALTDDNGRDLLAQEVELLSPRSFDAPGVYEGVVSPGTQTYALMPMKYKGQPGEVDEATLDLVKMYMTARGILLKQDGVGAHRLFFNKSVPVRDKNAVAVNIGRPFTNEEITNLDSILQQEFDSTDFSPVSTENGANIVNFMNMGDTYQTKDGIKKIDNRKFQNKVINALNSFEISDIPNPEGMVVNKAASQNVYVGNFGGWKENPNGEIYLEGTFGGRPDLQDRVRSIVTKYADRIEAAEQEIVERYGWTRNDRYNSRYRTEPEVDQQFDPVDEVLETQQPTEADAGDKQARPINQSPIAPRLELESGFFDQLENENLIFTAGMRAGSSAAGVARLGFEVYDKKFIENNLPPDGGRPSKETLKEARLGKVEINLVVDEEKGELTDEIEGMVNIEVAKNKRGQGAGRKIVENLFANADNDLRIYDIQKKAKKFWDILGTEYEPTATRRVGRLDGKISRIDKQVVEDLTPDKQARNFRNLSPQQQALVGRRSPDGDVSRLWGSITSNGVPKQYKGKPIPVIMPRGDRRTVGYEHAQEHLPEFLAYTPYENIQQALGSMMDAYAIPDRKGEFRTEANERGEYGAYEISWKDPESQKIIKAGFQFLPEGILEGQRRPYFALATMFPEGPTYSDVRSRPANFEREYVDTASLLTRNGTYRLNNVSPLAKTTAIETNMRKKVGPNTLTLPSKQARPISSEYSLKTKPIEMGVDVPSGMIAEEKNETLGQKVLGNLGMLKDGPLDSFGDFSKWFRRNMVDVWDPVRRTEIALQEKTADIMNYLSAENSAHAALRMARRGTAITAYSMSKGVPVYQDGYTSVKNIPQDAMQTNINGELEASRIAGQDVGLIPIIEPLRKGNRYNHFHLYSIARRAARLIREGREKLLTQEQIAQYLAMGNTTSEIATIMQLSEAEVSNLIGKKQVRFNDDFSNIFQDYQVWNSYFVDFLVQTGVLDSAKAEIWKETADYIPFYRQLDKNYESPLGETNMLEGLTASSPPPPLKGTGTVWTIVTTETINGEEVKNVLPTTFSSKEKKIAEAYAKKYTNETGVKTEINSQGMPMGSFLDNITENALSAVQTGMMNVGIQRTMRNLVLLEPETTVATKRVKGKTPTGSITFRVKGKPITLYVGDKALYSSLNNYLQNQQINSFVNLLGMPARFLREMVTRSPDFMVANMLRDSISAWATSGRDTNALAGTIGGFSKALMGNTSSDALAAAGLMTGFDFGGDPTKMTEFIDRELVKYKYPSSVGRFIRNPIKGIWDVTGTASRASDAATRIAVYEAVLKESGSEAQAIYEAQEVINFSARGSSAVIQNLAVMIPFLNARIQGLDVLYRASVGTKGFTARPESDIVKRRFITRALLVSMSSAAYWAMVHDDEEYINQNPEIKDNYWIIPSKFIPGYDGPPLKIPIPFEVGFLFKTIPERVMAYSFGKDVGRDVTQSLTRGLINTFEFLPVPQAALPIAEAITNHSFWTGRKIEGQYLEGLEPGYRVNSRTSALATKLGKELNYSPVLIDHMIKGYGGTLGTVALDAIDQVMRQASADLGERPTKNLSEYPFIKRFFARKDARGLVTEFYKLRESVTQAVKTSKALEEGELSIDESDEFALKRQKLIALDDEVKAIASILSDLRKQRKEIQNSNLSPEDKRAIIDDITIEELMAVQSLPDMKQEAFQ